MEKQTKKGKKKLNSNINYWDAVVAEKRPLLKELLRREVNSIEYYGDVRGTIVDIGCGSGRLYGIIPTHESINLIGFDFDKNALKIYSQKISKDINAKPILIQGTAVKLPFLDESIHFCILSMSLVNFGKDKLKALKEIERVLIPGHFAVISTYSEDSLEERLKIYNKYNVEIKHIDKATASVTFSHGLGTSDGISIEQMQSLSKKAKLGIIEIKIVKGIGYVYVLKKPIKEASVTK